MSASTAAVVCAACGAALEAAAGQVITCPACGAGLLVRGAEPFLELGCLPRLDADGARLAFLRLFERDGEPERQPAPEEAELLFVPFYELTGTMAGVAASGRPVLRWALAATPAIIDRDELGLDDVHAGRLEEALGPGQGGPSRAELDRHGLVLEPELDRAEVEAILAEDIRTPADGDEPRLIDRRLALLRYPVWRLSHRAHGVAFQATIDGLTGTVLRARLPAKQRRRIFMGVWAAACLGYVLGTMLRHPGLGLPGLGRAMAEAHPARLLPLLGLAALALGLYVLLLNAAWNALRYRNELVYHGGLKTRVLVNRPAETLLDRATGLLKRAWNLVVAPRRYDR